MEGGDEVDGGWQWSGVEWNGLLLVSVDTQSLGRRGLLAIWLSGCPSLLYIHTVECSTSLEQALHAWMNSSRMYGQCFKSMNT